MRINGETLSPFQGSDLLEYLAQGFRFALPLATFSRAFGARRIGVALPN